MQNIDHVLYRRPHNFAQVGRSVCKQVQNRIIKLLGNVVASRTTHVLKFTRDRVGASKHSHATRYVCIQPDGTVHHVSASGSACFLRPWIRTFAGVNSFVYVSASVSLLDIEATFTCVRTDEILCNRLVVLGYTGVCNHNECLCSNNTPFSRTGEAEMLGRISRRDHLFRRMIPAEAITFRPPRISRRNARYKREESCQE